MTKEKHWGPGKTSKQKATFQINTIARISIVRSLNLIIQKQIRCWQQKNKIGNKGVILTHQEMIFINPAHIYCAALEAMKLWWHQDITGGNTFFTASNLPGNLVPFPFKLCDNLKTCNDFKICCPAHCNLLSDTQLCSSRMRWFTSLTNKPFAVLQYKLITLVVVI